MNANASWTDQLSLPESLRILRDLATRHARKSGPYSQPLLSLLEGGDFKGICEYELSYDIGASATDVLEARQALGFFQKLEPLELGISKELVAYEKFVESEAFCKRTNDLFRSLARGTCSVPPAAWTALCSARRKIKGILGFAPSLERLKFAFGPGATTSIRKIDANPVAKLAKGFQCSTDVLASGLLSSVLREVPHWTSAHDSLWSIDEEGWLVETITVEVTPGNLAFVPKNAKTYRSIVVEPSLNGFVQTGIGKYIAQRLRAVGIDIRDQTANQKAAREGSLSGELATIDLSSASDLISRELVRFLLPRDWYSLLAAFRTSEVRYHDQSIFLEKFSSMGNGFTFPLETLLFYALTQSVCHDSRVLAYGDDIICPSTKYTDVVTILEFCGFSVNKAKSFHCGPFRESCGKDYYFGINVRPFYQKHLVSGQTLFTLHNFYARALDEESAAYVRALIPRHLRLYGPDGYGDGHLVSEVYPRIRNRKIRKNGYGGFYFETFAPLARSFINIYPGDWVSPLYAVYTRSLVCLHDLVPVVQGTGSVDTTSKGRPKWALPGVDGYSRKLIYTLG